jgi:hypothetical protein
MSHHIDAASFAQLKLRQFIHAEGSERTGTAAHYSCVDSVVSREDASLVPATNLSLIDLVSLLFPICLPNASLQSELARAA